ncbi:alanine dehydrogenase [Flavilitoribacter nigricans]|uniref:alanine dehydrogenase n=1 Tax=Flavilitoribacter nigricans (strain ATCC 23147 / DSM 23189 / NBRC 102662 / NCIMB 1420 / SS-2) TaxID=1122177 RepID=A0A2D0NG02_FLAN2|nr:alanine dehydrogenase [Flavilitoribacter nigricans]PHN07432.1 alanine dehydrogenase [Flavilitoribacter nigricans DSM 23189 = NBRC 102662]
MSEQEKKIPIPKIFTESKYSTQTEMLPVKHKSSKLFIGIPKELTLQENRVALVPSSVATLIGHGHRVMIETGAGEKSHFSDHDYSEVGAEIAYSQEQVYKAHVILKVAPPTLKEIDLMQPNQILISPLQLPIISAEYILKLRQKRVIALAMEYIKDDESDTFPVVRIMSEMAGLNAMLTAAELLSTTGGGKGVLLGGISGVPSSKVVILGAGIVAEYATRAALGLGAEVRIFDDNIYKLKRIQNQVGRPLYTSAFNPVYLERELVNAEVAIGAIHSEDGRTPVIVSEEMVSKMKSGSVIVDVSIDQGGCFATSRVTTLSKPTFTKHEVIHYCVPNIASKVARTASIAVSNILTPILLKAGSTGSIETLFFSNLGLRHGIYTYKGCLTNEYLGRRFEIKSTDLDLLITSSL